MANNWIALRTTQLLSQKRKKHKLKNALPLWLVKRLRFTLNYFRLVDNYLYDWRRFIRYSALGGRPRNATHFNAYLTMDYHSLEKGLSLRNPRPLFGQLRIQKILSTIELYAEKFGATQALEVAIKTLRVYQNYHRDRGIEAPFVNEFLKSTRFTNNHAGLGGTSPVSKADIHQRGKLDLWDFFYSRYSVRDFSDEPVSVDLIQKAVAMAQKSPSVCNRQASHVYVLTDKREIQSALAHQNGNRGFKEKIDKLLIVSSDLQAFVSSGERNQAWIDGGMFAMSLVYGLHSLGLGTCCLNWSVDRRTDRALRRSVNLNESEGVIMMIAVGHLPEQFNVAQSPRKNLEEVITLR